MRIYFRKLILMAVAIALVAAGWVAAKLQPNGATDTDIGMGRLVRGIDPSPRAQASPGIRGSRYSKVVDIAQRISPGVVTVGTTMMVRGRSRDPFEGFFRPFRDVPAQEGYFPYIGSGFLINEQSLMRGAASSRKASSETVYALTNYHVVQDSKRIFITLTDGRQFEAKLLDADSVVDVALLKIDTRDGKPLPSLKLGNSDDIMVGESVVALGNPFGPLIEDPQPTVTVGVVSAVNRSFQPEVDPNSGAARVYQNMIQTDASINPGNSGGPLVNLDGEVIGINTFILSAGGKDRAGSAGVNFSTPINRAIKVAQEILLHGRVRSLYVDFDVVAVTSRLVAQLSLKESHGLLIWNLARNGPAMQSGLQPGDVIQRVNGREMRSREDLMASIYARTVGEKLEFQVSRDGQPLKAEYEIKEAPARN